MEGEGPDLSDFFFVEFVMARPVKERDLPFPTQLRYSPANILHAILGTC